MIGVFDSGVGGLTALSELRRLSPSADICYFADRKNAPYGTKDRGELTRLVSRDIDILRREGADRILIACCTASAAFADMNDIKKEQIYEIITPTVKEAVSVSRSGRIGYISTAYTKNSFEFENRIRAENAGCEVYGVSASELVGIAERGERDGELRDESIAILERILDPLLRQRVDTVILGCTHFTYFEKTVGAILGAQTVSSARAGARSLLSDRIEIGEGRTKYIDF